MRVIIINYHEIKKVSKLDDNTTELLKYLRDHFCSIASWTSNNWYSSFKQKTKSNFYF